MNLKERLAKLLKELDAAETLEDAKRIKGEIEAVQAQIALAEEKAGILEGMKAAKPVGGNAKAKPRTLGEKAAVAVKAAGASRDVKFTASTANLKDGDAGSGDAGSGDAGSGDSAATVTITPTARPVGDYAPVLEEIREDVIQGARRPLTVADLFAQETTTKDAVTYFTEGAVTGTPTTVAEGGTYPTLTFGEPVKHTDALQKIGCLYKDTDELLEDAPRLAQNIDQRADYLMDITEEDQLVSGDGTGSNLTGLLNRSGIQTASAVGMEAALKAIKSAKVGIKKNTPGFRADGLLINDEDWDELTSVQDANKQFLAGGPFYGQYGNGSGPVEEPPLWGLRVVPTQAVAKGTMVIGAFKLGGSVIRKGGRVVDITNSDVDDFENGLIAIRPSERVALAVRYPAAFVKLTVTAPQE